MNRCVTLPTFQPDALAFFRAKVFEDQVHLCPEEGQNMLPKHKQGNAPVHKLVLENHSLSQDHAG